jgi:hypothetical protein
MCAGVVERGYCGEDVGGVVKRTDSFIETNPTGGDVRSDLPIQYSYGYALTMVLRNRARYMTWRLAHQVFHSGAILNQASRDLDRVDGHAIYSAADL